MRTCPNCKIEKPLTEFYIHQKTQKPFSYCKVCKRSKEQDFYAANRHRICETQASWRHRNKERVAECERNYYRKHRQQCIDDATQWNRINKPKRQRMHQKWRSRNPEKYLLISASARAKKRRKPFSITVADIHIPDCCPYLGIRLQQATGKANDGSPSIDCIVPELGYVPGNIEVISRRANVLKGNGTAEEHYKIARRLEILTRKPAAA